MADPNGWVTNPPQTLVKVVNTSRDNINNRLGVVVGFATDRGRYIVHLTTSGEQVSLKPENLQKASYLEQLQGQYQLLRHDRNAQRQLNQIYQQVQNTTGLPPEYVGIGVLGLILLSFWKLGFSKTLMAISFAMMVFIVILPDLGSSASTILRNIPMRVREVIRRQVPYGDRIANNNLLVYGFIGLVLVFFVSTMLKSTTTTTRTTFEAGENAPITRPTTTLAPDMQEYYYKLGFDDATANHEFGTSLPKEPIPPRVVGEFDEGPYVDDEPTTPPPRQQPMSWSILLSVFYLLNTLYRLGLDSNQQWTLSQFKHGLANMDMIRMIFLGLSIARLVGRFVNF